MGVDFADVNHDGHLDIFVVDMLSRSAELRKRQIIAKRPTAPRPGDVATRVQTPQNTLLLNRGDGTYAEIACLAGLQANRALPAGADLAGLAAPAHHAKRSFDGCGTRHDADAGEAQWGANLNIGYYDQRLDEFDPDNTVYDEVSQGRQEKGLHAIRDVLAERVRQMMLTRTDKQVFLRIDGRLNVQHQMDVFDELKAGGVRDVGIVTDAPTANSK